MGALLKAHPQEEQMHEEPQVHRLSRTELYERVWTTPMCKLAAEFGLSDVALAKLCRRHAIPSPPRGYWMKPPSEQQSLRPALPRFDGAGREDIEIFASPAHVARGQRTGRPTPLRVTVPQESTRLRPIVELTVRSLRTSKRGEDGRTTPRAINALPIIIGPQSIDRAARILDTLLGCLEERGHTFAVKEVGHRRQMTATVSGEELVIVFSEELAREEREPTASEKRLREQHSWLYRDPPCRYLPSGRLSLRIDHYCSGLRKHWGDGKRQRLEKCLGAFVEQLELVAATTTAEREEREAANQERWAWEAKRAAALQSIHDEEVKLERLRAQADAWHQSQRLRLFVDAVRTGATTGSVRYDGDIDDWLSWASAHADRLDPLVASPPSILDQKKYYETTYYKPYDDHADPSEAQS